MHTRQGWIRAPLPNYDTNIDKHYPYSEVPFLGDYHLIKLPVDDQLVDLIDYWGEGRISIVGGVSGFPDCYNVNHEYQLVSNGPDQGRKIPNRIAVISYTNCNTSAYVANDKVRTVTLMGAPINDSCAADISRIVNAEQGRVFIYGFAPDAADVRNLERELEKKHLSYCPDYELPHNFKGLILFDSHRAYLNRSELTVELYNNIVNASYDNAVNITKSLIDSKNEVVIQNAVLKCINDGRRNIMEFAYKLWHGDYKTILTEQFPTPFRLIFNEDGVKIVNALRGTALKLDANIDSYGDRLAWGDNADLTSQRVVWTIIPEWVDNAVYFKIKNQEHNMLLKLDVNADAYGDRLVWGAPLDTSVERRLFYFEPTIKDDYFMFYIVNKEFGQPLKLDVNTDNYGDRKVWGNNGWPFNEPYRFGWKIQSWP